MPFAVILSEIFALSLSLLVFQEWQFATVLGAFKYYCSHYGSLLTSFFIVWLYVRGRMRSRFHCLVRIGICVCVCGCSIPLFCMFFGSQAGWKWQKKCCKKLTVVLNRFAFFRPIPHYNLAFVFQGTVGGRNTKLRNESVIFVYLSVSFVRMLSIGVLLSMLKLRSP